MFSVLFCIWLCKTFSYSLGTCKTKVPLYFIVVKYRTLMILIADCFAVCQVMWIVLKFFLLATEISVVVFSLLFGRYDYFCQVIHVGVSSYMTVLFHLSPGSHLTMSSWCSCAVAEKLKVVCYAEALGSCAAGHEFDSIYQKRTFVFGGMRTIMHLCIICTTCFKTVLVVK